MVAFFNLPNLCHAQGMHFQAVETLLVHNCHKFSLASASKLDYISKIIDYIYNTDTSIYWELHTLLQQLVNVCESHDTCNGKPSSENTQEFAVGVQAEASSESGSRLTSSQPQVLMNEHSMDQQHSLGETDTTLKPQGVKISAEEGITSTNVKTLTSSNDSKSASSSSPHLELIGSSLDPLITSGCKTSSKEDGDFQTVATSLFSPTTETNDEVSLNGDASKKISSNIEEQFPNDDKIIFSKSKPSPSISSPFASQFPSIPSKGDPSQKVEELSSFLPITKELEQLVSKKHLDYENSFLLTDFLYKHPSVLLKDNSLSNRYKGYAYNCLAELLKFLQTHSVLDVLGSNHYEFVELLQDVRKCGFDKDWLDGIERRILFPNLKYQLTSSEAVLESIIQQKRVLSAPIGY